MPGRLCYEGEWESRRERTPPDWLELDSGARASRAIGKRRPERVTLREYIQSTTTSRRMAVKGITTSSELWIGQYARATGLDYEVSQSIVPLWHHLAVESLVDPFQHPFLRGIQEAGETGDIRPRVEKMPITSVISVKVSQANNLVPTPLTTVSLSILEGILGDIVKTREPINFLTENQEMKAYKPRFCTKLTLLRKVIHWKTTNQRRLQHQISNSCTTAFGVCSTFSPRQ